MGAEQSSPRNGGQDKSPVKKCYYEVLGVERLASDDEIKKAYRKKALELHPDRNYGDVDNATSKFAEVQSAYEVLSDPQERAWYDSHRDSILRGDSGGPEEDRYEHNVRLTSARDIVSLMSKFNTSVPLTDAPNGFYGILRVKFENLAEEEDAACDWEGIEAVQYPSFGSATDNFEDVVRPFYKVWMNFFTKKSFSWRDAYKASDAPDRATRRLIEKENKRLRDEGIREFNDAVKALVAFVRKRDPRFVPNAQTESDRQKILRDAAAAQAARSRAANQAKLNEHVTAEWTKTREVEDEVQSSDTSESEVEHIECIVCGKTFKTENSYIAHEKSKKHAKAVQTLQREMMKENRRLNLDNTSDSSRTTPAEEFEKIDLKVEDAEVKEEYSTPADQEGRLKGNRKLKGEDEGFVSEAEENLGSELGKAAGSTSNASDAENEYASREAVEDRLAGLLSDAKSTQLHTQANHSSATSEPSDPDATSQQKLGKAKAKRARKAARLETEAREFKCAACHETFPSKSKLFAHIKDMDHAQPVAKSAKGNNKRG